MAMLFVGGSRAHHYQDLFAEIGMRTVAAGYEFAHRDDYEGRQRAAHHQGRRRQPQHRGTARRARPGAVPAPHSAEELRRLRAGLLTDYEGMMPEMDDGRW